MHIEFLRSGGFANIRLTVSMDIEQLSADEGDMLRKLIDEADFFDLPARLDSATKGADRFVYRVSITAVDRAHTVIMGEADIPDRVQPLIDNLTNLARTSRSS